MTYFNGLHLHLGNLSRLSFAKTRSISAENFTGEKGKGGRATSGATEIFARDLGQGWKISPCVTLKPGETFDLANIQGPGAIQHIWMTVSEKEWRRLILRFFWDDETDPSVEVPIGDFFCNGWCKPCLVNSLPVAVNPRGGFNSYWEMPFRKKARITVENLSDAEIDGFFYQIDYTLTQVPEDVGYFHAQWRRKNPVPYKDVYTIIDGIEGHGHYVGTYMAWGVNQNGWWGEGEIKFFMDDDKEFPTICGTGTEDYFCGAWGFDYPKNNYCEYSTAYSGMPQIIRPDGFTEANQRFGLYRWHVMDPIRFEKNLRVTIQDLGWRTAMGKESARFLARQDDIASVAFWYQKEPHGKFPELPDRDFLEVI
ncbi:hypothetical protein B6D60_05000 [candidate division KSB1 bacterium 4484_87]|nr:MAG: hypothetical protein B6D60_05000 [candidate division KSB1 bacterium 4484_87]